MNKKRAAVLLLSLGITLSAGAAGWNFTPLPVVFYTSDTGIAGGGLLVVERAGDGNMLLQTAATYTQKRQAEISSLFQSDFGGGVYRVSGSFGFFNTPSLFYGVGPEADAEESYDQRKLNFEGALMRRMWRQLFVGGLYLYNYVAYSGFEVDGDFVPYIDADDPSEVSSELGLVVQWDSRDSLTYPRSGRYLELRATSATTAIGSESVFGKVKLDVRSYSEVLPDTVLALQGIATYGNGEVPLHRMEELGGLKVLRGYRFGRYRDESIAVVQSELRFPIYRRLGGVVFAGAGQIGESFDSFSLENTKYSGGAGLRFRPNKNSDVRIRVDFGICRESTGIYITLLEAF